ncbi:MAG: peptidase C39 [Tepidisphaeraceae bacterium]
MSDLLIGYGILSALTAVALVAGLRLGRALPAHVGRLAVAGVVALILVFHQYLLDGLFWAKVLPFSNVIILANLLPVLVGLLAGLAWRFMSGGVIRKAVVIVPLSVAGCYVTGSPVFARPPATGEVWRGRVCRQTTSSSCSPAAAATLLRAHGIPATETEMVALCLTGEDGTPMLGLYRGLKLKTRDTNYDVEVFTGNMEAFLADARRGAAVISVMLPWEGAVDNRYEKDWGWIPGQKHTVAFFGRSSGEYSDIGDPAVGRETWHNKALQTLWTGEAIRLVRRAGAPELPPDERQFADGW